MFILRINRIRVFDNRTRKAFLGLLGEDSANLQVVSFVATEEAQLPNLNRFIDTTDEDERRRILEEAVSDTLSSRVFTTFPRVRDGHILTFGDAGYAVHQTVGFPETLDWTVLIIKSNRRTRKLGIMMEEVVAGDRGATLEANVLRLLSTAAGTVNPAYLAGAAIARFVGESAGEILKQRDDEVIGLFYCSLNRREHYRHGERKVDNAPGVTGNMSIDYSLFGIEPEVRRAIPVERTLVAPPETDERESGEPEIIADPLPELSEAAVGPSTDRTDPAIEFDVPSPRSKRIRIGTLVDAPVYSLQGDSAFFFISDLDVDADGSPRAYHPTSSEALDYLANAGRPGNWWGIACTPAGRPYRQRQSDPAPGYYVSCTALFDPSKELRDPDRYVDAERIPYIVLPMNHATDARLGDLGMIVNLRNGKSVGAIFADVGGKSHVGEASIAAAEALGIPSDAKSGGAPGDIFYLVFPGSGNRRPRTVSQIESQTGKLFREWGGMEQVRFAVDPTSRPPEPLARPSVEVVSGALEQLVDASATATMEEIADDRPLARQIQGALIQLGLLDPPIDGIWGPVSRSGWALYHGIAHVGTPEKMTRAAAERLLSDVAGDFLPLALGDDWIAATCQLLLDQGHWLARGPGLTNIIYTEGINEDGTRNDDAPNAFNDLRMVLTFVKGKPVLQGAWQATTEPGRRYTEQPLVAGGAARIAFGQYKAWQVGQHPRNSPRSHQALRQVRRVKVHRDYNKDYRRHGDKIEEGLFGLNQHWGYDLPENDIRNASAGCLVGRTRAGHRDFMQIVKADPRFKATGTYRFLTTILDGRLLDLPA